jgi:hypothetical protein
MKYEHLLRTTNDSARSTVGEPQEDFREVDVQADAKMSPMFGKLLMISLRSDWEPVPGWDYVQIWFLTLYGR